MMIMVEGLTLSLIPMLAFDSLDSSDMNVDAISKLYKWLKCGNFTYKVLTANRFFAKNYLKGKGIPQNHEAIIAKHLQKKSVDRVQDYYLPVACAILTSTEENLTLNELNKYKGVHFKDFLAAYIRMVEKQT